MQQAKWRLILVIVISLDLCYFGWTFFRDFVLASQLFFGDLNIEYGKYRNPQQDEANKHSKGSSCFPAVFTSTNVPPINVVWSHRLSRVRPNSSNEPAIMMIFPAGDHIAPVFYLGHERFILFVCSIEKLHTIHRSEWNECIDYILILFLWFNFFIWWLCFCSSWNVLNSIHWL